VQQARSELLEAVREGSDNFQNVSALVDVLLASELPFREQQLGGGPWQVCAGDWAGDLNAYCSAYC
jgi:hypothetical protein